MHIHDIEKNPQLLGVLTQIKYCVEVLHASIIEGRLSFDSIQLHQYAQSITKSIWFVMWCISSRTAARSKQFINLQLEI